MTATASPANMTDPARGVIRSITAEEMKQKLATESEVELIDVRSPAEYRGVHITAARNVPLDALDVEAFKAERADDPGKPLYVVCHSGGRSSRACEALASAGIEVVNVLGGTAACEKAGCPVERQKGVISIERQVRIGAGSLVVIGVALGVLVNPWFLAVSGFVGCGLIFAGVTDFCGMGLMLAKMPWNR